MRNILFAIAFTAVLLPQAANAVPWCWKGQEVVVATVTLDEGGINYWFAASRMDTDGWYPDDQFYAFHAAAEYCENKFGGNVAFAIFGPDEYGSADYSIDLGISFRCITCVENLEHEFTTSKPDSVNLDLGSDR